MPPKELTALEGIYEAHCADSAWRSHLLSESCDLIFNRNVKSELLPIPISGVSDLDLNHGKFYSKHSA